MGRLKNTDKAKMSVEKRVSMVMTNLRTLRSLGLANAMLLSDSDLQKMRITMAREVEGTVDAIEMQKIHLQEGHSKVDFNFS